MTVIRLLATISIVALAVTVAAPATKTAKAVAGHAKTVKVLSPPSHKVVRRAKRSLVVQVPVEIEDEIAEQNELEAELSQLSDEQLEILAGVVQEELDRYDPQLPVDQYQIVDIPVEYLTHPRDRRSMPIAPIGDEDEEEVVFVPEDVLQEAMVEEALEEAAQEELAKELDEMELRVRIGEMADILNERASRRSRR
ncbi:hypothetical protein PFISCL1PPCAC_20136 [Pristionchus fissidentatus]|uniref:Uncharacterized protein n=1 Tax=Pristionchus fissidentatus TaxID=1538716 RepID=A0AAV5WG77_9BILA|nr:hypothetical protein PFISCL1PPCAC_20136 [Pristionchus fissidentatus]